MQDNKFIYTFQYLETERDLCKLESKSLFYQEEKNKQLFSNHKVDPSISAFIKLRLDIICQDSDFSSLLSLIKEKDIRTDGFKVDYVILNEDHSNKKEHQTRAKEVGFCIDTYPDFEKPRITYGICTFSGRWYFGVLVKNKLTWQKHKDKPFSYSNSIKQNIAKALVNIAASSKKNIKLLDACCGVGTIMLEACYAGYEIEGCDINPKICNNALANLSHFNYKAKIHTSDITNLSDKYDAAIIDLPYNIYSPSTEDNVRHILSSTSTLTDRMVIVSTEDITQLIIDLRLTIIEYCEISKRGKSKFTRRIWVCEMEET